MAHHKVAGKKIEYLVVWLINTYERFFKHLDSKAFHLCFMKWTQSIAQAFKGVIAIDYKILCNSGDNQTDPIHIVSEFAAENSLVLGHQKCSGKGKELEAIQKLLQILDIKGAYLRRIKAEFVQVMAQRTYRYYADRS